jgi:hypothetical protein
MIRSEAQFLHEQNGNFHSSQEVEEVVGYLRASGERIPNEPSYKIVAYMGFLAHSDYVNDGLLTGNQESIERQVERYVIRREDVPEAFSRSRSHLASNERIIEWAQEDQRSRLKEWAEHLSSEESDYPLWFRYYAFNSLVKLGRFDYDKQQFQKRSKYSKAGF